MGNKKGEASGPPIDKVSALRSALRSAPPRKSTHPRSPLKAAVAQLLPDLLAFRAKGYTSAELAEIMRKNGFTIAAATLIKYISEARARTTNRRKNKAVVATEAIATTVNSGARAADATTKMATPPSLLSTKPLAQNRRAARDVLGHRFDYDV